MHPADAAHHYFEYAWVEQNIELWTGNGEWHGDLVMDCCCLQRTWTNQYYQCVPQPFELPSFSFCSRSGACFVGWEPRPTKKLDTHHANEGNGKLRGSWNGGCCWTCQNHYDFCALCILHWDLPPVWEVTLTVAQKILWLPCGACEIYCHMLKLLKTLKFGVGVVLFITYQWNANFSCFLSFALERKLPKFSKTNVHLLATTKIVDDF